MDGTDTPVIPRGERGRFAPGGPGRPRGAVGKASARVSRAILADFESNQSDLDSAGLGGGRHNLGAVTIGD